jgi:hypothetical protein
MLKSRLIKAITLILFVTSVTAFVAYRGGYVSLTDSDSILNASEVTLTMDSVPNNIYVLSYQPYLPSSKSIVIPRPLVIDSPAIWRLIYHPSIRRPHVLIDTTKLKKIKIEPVNIRK